MSEPFSAPITPGLLRIFLNEAPSIYIKELDRNARNLILTNCYRSLWSNDLELMRKYFFKGVVDAESLTSILRKHKLLDDHDESSVMLDSDMTKPLGNSPGTPSSQCGHLFKRGDAVYRCRYCGLNDTCVLCSKCFHASQHEGHNVTIKISQGTGGCCDCGDPEAWKIPLECAAHPLTQTAPGSSSHPLDSITETKATVPEHLLQSIRDTIDVVLDYILETFASSPEEISPTSAEVVEEGRAQSHAALGLTSVNNQPPLYACVLWNDESHTFEDVINVVSKATNRTEQFSKKVAEDVDAVGRRIVEISSDLEHLLRVADIIHQETLAITVRSIQDTIREDICGLLLHWLNDLVSDHHKFFFSVQGGEVIVRDAICEALSAEWLLRPELAVLSTQARRVRRNDDTDYLGDPDEDYDSFGEDDDMDEEMQVPLDYLRDIFAGDQDDEISTHEEDDLDEADYEDDEDSPADNEDWAEISQQLRNNSDEIMTEVDNIPPLVESQNQQEDPSISSAQRRHSNSSHTKAPQQKQPHDLVDLNVELEPWLAYTQKMESDEHKLVEAMGIPADDLESTTADVYERTRKEFKQKLRLDYLLQFDLRLWKSARSSVKNLLIGTFISNFNYRPVLAARYARNYAELVDAFMFKDREPEHSISTLSVQLLTVPTVAATLLKDYKFFSMVCSALTNFFLTDRIRLLLPDFYKGMQVNCRAKAIERLRYTWTIYDLRYVFYADQVKEIVAKDSVHIRHFADLLSRFQEMDPVQRRIGTHVEFESSDWMKAFNVTLQVSKLCPLFADCFTSPPSEKASRNLCRSIYRLVQTIVEWTPSIAPIEDSNDNSEDHLLVQGVRSQRFHTIDTPHAGSFEVVDYNIAKEAVSFHHPLHWLLSELLEHVSLMQDELLASNGWPDGFKQMIQGIFKGASRDHFLVLIEYPLRTIALLAQANAGVWIRNGSGLHNHYRDLGVRQNTYDPDVYLLQAAFVATDPDHLLVTMLDRFNAMDWFNGKPNRQHPDYEPRHLTYIVEEFLQLLVICATEHGYASGMSVEAQIRRYIVQYLGIANRAHSDLLKLLPDRLSEHESFESQLDTLANLKPPVGSNDSGMYELKSEYIDEIDPYFWHYTCNQREEAYSALKKHAQLHGTYTDPTNKEEFLLVPKPKKITVGPFKHLGNFLHSRTMCQIILNALWNAKAFKQAKSDTILDDALYLAMLAVTDENNEIYEQTRALKRGKFRTDTDVTISSSFVQHAVQDEYTIQVNEKEREHATLLKVLQRCFDDSELKHAHKRLLFVIKKIGELGSSETKDSIAQWQGLSATSAASVNIHMLSNSEQAEKERRKEAAKARQAAVMSQFEKAQEQFMSHHGDLYEDDEEDEDELEEAGIDQEHSITNNGDNAQVERMCHFQSGTCIVCQEELNRSRLYCMLGLVQKSHILRKAPLRNTDVLREILDACLPESDRAEKTINKDPNTKLELAGFPSDEYTSGHHMSSCGHMMHAHCFDIYHASVEIEETLSHRHARGKGFLCPLCKAPGNLVLPVVWKGKKESYPGVMAVHTPYESVDKNAKLEIQRLDDILEAGAREQIPGSMPDMEEDIEFVNPDPSNVTISSMDDLLMLYSNLLKTLDATGKTNQENDLGVDLNTSILHLLDMYTYTISAIEIAQRGVQRQTIDLTVERTGTFLDGVSKQNQTLLKILAKTIELLPRVMNTRWVTDDRHVMDRLAREALLTMFYDPARPGKNRAILLDDPFRVLTQVGFCLGRHDDGEGVEIHSFMRLAYVAELSKTAIGLIQYLTGAEVLDDPKMVALVKQVRTQQPSTTAEKAACDCARMIMSLLNVPDTFVQSFFDQIDPTLFVGLLRIFTLPFLRKCLLLSVVHHGFMVQSQLKDEQMNRDEYDNLLDILRLPTFDTVFDLQPVEVSALKGWCSAYSAHLTQPSTRPVYTRLPNVPLYLPVRFSLVSLPYRMDQLFDENLRVCRLCKNVPKYPALCLMCGDTVCTRINCCTVDDKGGCNMHMQKCGGEIGVYMVIEECLILLLHANGGTIMSAPYLDAHGEADPHLKRGTPQYLNAKRYEQLRQLWLSHSIPAFVRRRMESAPSINNLERYLNNWERW